MSRRLFFLSLIAFQLAGCEIFQDAVYDKEISPYIKFKSLEFIDPDQWLDTLKVTIDIWDEDGDLGLGLGAHMPPYHEHDVIVDATDRIVTFSGRDYKLPFYKKSSHSNSFSESDVFSVTDNRPPSFSCEHYDTMTVSLDNESYLPDTIFIKRNDGRYNIDMGFYVKENGSDKELDFEYLTSQYGCGENFNGIFPATSSGNSHLLFKHTQVSKFHSRLEYAMVSAGFGITFREDLFKLRVKIRDRALNVSNEIETDYATLEDITN